VVYSIKEKKDRIYDEEGRGILFLRPLYLICVEKRIYVVDYFDKNC